MRILCAFLPRDGPVADYLVLFGRNVPAIDYEQLSQQPGPVDVAQAKTQLDGYIVHRRAESAALAAGRGGPGLLVRCLVAGAPTECHTEDHGARRAARRGTLPF